MLVLIAVISRNFVGELSTGTIIVAMVVAISGNLYFSCFRKKSIRSTAVHEAGHATMCYLLGCNVSKMQLHVLRGSTTTYQSIRSKNSTIAYHENETKICFAGQLAVKSSGICPSWVGCERDSVEAYFHARIAFMLLEGAKNISCFRNYIRRLRLDADNAITQNCLLVDKLAETLAAKKQLDDLAIRAILSEQQNSPSY